MVAGTKFRAQFSGRFDYRLYWCRAVDGAGISKRTGGWNRSRHWFRAGAGSGDVRVGVECRAGIACNEPLSDNRHPVLVDALGRISQYVLVLGVVRATCDRNALGLSGWLILSRHCRLGFHLPALLQVNPRHRPRQSGLYQRADPGRRHAAIDVVRGL